ncbi:hypothetical protein DTO013E5_9786 [Penicillium roqueforti]|nr:hypothetical protein CBS147337_10111 [Penicillium roqueforti]KAI2674536.1 hypothetical protein CBS147355_7150 [Penicillium roqueforti]KAI2683804.1 hypothetical protein LCP963914a_5634 [Penicillium roqueforti]KAI2694596.1 hypothetical protein CBS147372_9719 [Penicillium roqueforti]KAI2711064.1 hypothetical protein CBS147318_8444 [Penicillium roqueforti]
MLDAESNLLDFFSPPDHPTPSLSHNLDPTHVTASSRRYSATPSSSSIASAVSRSSTRNQASNSTVERSLAKLPMLTSEMGFESFDHLATTYCTASFSEGSFPRYAQSASRSQRLRGLLTDLYISSKDWVGKEAHGYYEGQLQLLETVCTKELGGICAKQPQRCLESPDQRGDRQQPQSPKRVRRTQAFIVNMIKQLFTDDGAEQMLKRDRQLLKEQIPSLWSLLSQVAQRTNVGVEESSLAICVFVYFLQVPL